MKKTFFLKFISLFLTLCFILSCGITLIACGGEEQPNVSDVPDTPDEPDVPDTPDTPDAPDTPDEPDTPDTPDTPDEPAEPDVDEEEPVFEIIKLKNPLKVFGGKRPYGIIAEDGVDSTIVEQLSLWVGNLTGTAAQWCMANAGSFQEANIKVPKIIIGNMTNLSWTAAAREKMGDAKWIVSAEEKHIVIVGTSADEVKKGVACLCKALVYYTAHTGSEEIVLPNDFCITSNEGSDQFDMYTLTTKKSEQYHFPRFVFSSYCDARTVDAALCEKIVAGGYQSGQLGCGSVEANRAALKLMEQYGLSTDGLFDQRLMGIVWDSADDYTYEQIRDLVAQVHADYADCPNVTGYFVIDEPSAERFDMLAMIVRAFREVCPDREPNINLFPSGASCEQLGVPSFEEYISLYLEKVNPYYLQVDHYTFNLKDGQRVNNSCGFFNDMAVMRKWAGYYGIDTELVVQLDRWGETIDQVGPTQVMWEVNMPLAYGFKRINYFTFFGITMFSQYYEGDFGTQRYEAAKVVNAALYNVGVELFTKESVAVYSYNTAALPTYEVSSLEVAYTPEAGLGTISGSGSAVIGTFDDGSVYFVNRAAYDGDADTYVLGGYTADLEWFDPSDGAWKDASTCPAMTKTAEGWTITLNPANAVLFRAK